MEEPALEGGPQGGDEVGAEVGLVETHAEVGDGRLGLGELDDDVEQLVDERLRVRLVQQVQQAVAERSDALGAMRALTAGVHRVQPAENLRIQPLQTHNTV